MATFASELSQAVLEQRIDELSRALLFWTFIVVVGLILEYGYDGLKEADKKNVFRWSKLFSSFGGILVVVGVAGELFVQFPASRAENSLRQLNDNENSELRSKATELQNQNLQLEKLIQPRRLSGKEQCDIGAALSQFKGMAVGISYRDAESYFFGGQIAAALKCGKLNPVLDTRSILWTSPNGRTYSEFVDTSMGVGICSIAAGEKLEKRIVQALTAIGHVDKLHDLSKEPTQCFPGPSEGAPVRIVVLTKPYADVPKETCCKAKGATPR